MKKHTRKLILLILCILLLSLYWYIVHYQNINPLENLGAKNNSPPPVATSNIPSFVTSHGNLQIIFCPSDECLNAYLTIISNATTSLDCALFEIDHPQIQNAIRNKSNTIPVRIVTDNDYYKEFHEPYVRQDKSGLMHNKFCIADNKILLAGSANPTENDMGKNNNNIVITTSYQIINNYQDEFIELWSGIFKKGEPTKNPQITIINNDNNSDNSNNNIQIETYFCPEDKCEKHVVSELTKASKQIDCMTFSFTSNNIANALISKHLEQIPIRCVLETRMESKYSQYTKLKYQDLDVHLDGNKYTMHHKVFIIDNETVITGSFNTTAGGDTKNDENIMIIHSKTIAEMYEHEFFKVYNAALMNETIKEN